VSVPVEPAEAVRALPGIRFPRFGPAKRALNRVLPLSAAASIPGTVIVQRETNIDLIYYYRKNKKIHKLQIIIYLNSVQFRTLRTAFIVQCNIYY
jgi:hypothetical protein